MKTSTTIEIHLYNLNWYFASLPAVHVSTYSTVTHTCALNLLLCSIRSQWEVSLHWSHCAEWCSDLQMHSDCSALLLEVKSHHNYSIIKQRQKTDSGCLWGSLERCCSVGKLAKTFSFWKVLNNVLIMSCALVQRHILNSCKQLVHM